MKTSNGFTLIEMLMVVIIAGIVLALSAPNFSKGYSRFQMNRTADDLLNCSRWAQAMAIGQERIIALSFSRDHRSYDLTRMQINEESDDPQNFEPVNGSLGRMHSIPKAVNIETKNDNIDFYPDGTIDPATIELDAPGQKTTLSSAEVRGMMTKAENE